MKEKSKKILKRVGAAFLLGLSFLSFGSGWGGQRAKSVSRRAQNLRKETQEEVDSEVKQIADIAEKEAADVISQEMQQRDQQQQMQQQSQTRIQTTLRFAAVGGWGVAMAVFFTSMIFNQPFGLGKAALSLLPGEPHVATLAVITERDDWRVGEDIIVDVQLSTNEEKVNFFKTAIEYDPAIIELQKISIDETKFNILEENKSNKKDGTITIIARKTGSAQNLRKEVIAKLTFKALQKNKETKVSINQAGSLVLKTKQKDNRGYNILGKVKNSDLKIIGNVEESIKCAFIDVVQSRMDKKQWEWLTNSAPTPLKNGNNWVETDNGSSILCAHSGDGGVYILVYDNKIINDFQITNVLTGNNAEIIKTDKWKIGSGNFYAVIVDGNKMIKDESGKFRNLAISFNVGGEKQRWPKKGSGEIGLIKK